MSYFEPTINQNRLKRIGFDNHTRTINKILFPGDMGLGRLVIDNPQSWSIDCSGWNASTAEIERQLLLYWPNFSYLIDSQSNSIGELIRSPNFFETPIEETNYDPDSGRSLNL